MTSSSNLPGRVAAAALALLAPLVCGSAEPPRGDPASCASAGGVAAFAAVLVVSIVAGALLRRRRKARPLRRVLLAASLQRPRDP